MRVELHPEARSEVAEAAKWYDDREAGVGAELADEAERSWRQVGYHLVYVLE